MTTRRKIGRLVCWMLVVASRVPSVWGQEVPRPAAFLRQIPWAESGVWLKADTHVHTQFSDGQYSVSEVAAQAARFGCDVLAITDHGDRNLRAATPEYFEAIRVARRQFPNLLLLAGIEWNVPPFGGDEHATVLVSPQADEERILTELKHRFDDYQRTDSTSALAAQGIRFLGARATPEHPVVMMLNHPGRKGRDRRAITDTVEQWRSLGGAFVAISGAPGHQRAQSLGAYPQEQSLVDRWDPVAATVGGTWDQLLQKGLDVWAARAPSDFHDDNPAGLHDYWPGEFSETWLYAPARTPTAALEALRAGSCFAAHGHIVREVQLLVDSAGLPRPAIAGEEIEVDPNATITVTLRLRVPPTDWEGKPNQIDAVELIAIAPTKAEVIATGNPDSHGLALTHSLSVTTPIVLRARGRRTIADRPDLMFYTNPVRVSVRNTPAPTLVAEAPGSDGSASHGSQVVPWVRRLGAIALVVLVVATWRRPSTAQSPQRRAGPQLSDRYGAAATRPTLARGDAAPRQGHLIVAALGMTVFAVYGSLVPLTYEPLPWNEAVERFLRTPFFEISVAHRADFVANILLFIPIGFFWLGAFTVDRPGRLWRLTAATIVSVNAAVLSLAVEFTQLWFPPRTVSQNDIVAETIGGAIGVCCWLLVGQPLVAWARSYAAAIRRTDQLSWLLQAYLLGLVLYSLMPFDLTISVGEVFDKYEEGRIALWHSNSSLPQALYEYLTNALLYFPIGALAASFWTPPQRPLRTLVASTVLGGTVVIGIEAAQLLVYSRYSDLSDVLTGIAGAAAGAYGIRRWKRPPDGSAASGPVRVPRTVAWLGAAAGYYVLVLAIFWWPFDFVADAATWRTRYSGLIHAPFARLYWGTELNFATEVLRKLLFFAPLGPLLVKAVRCTLAPPAVQRVLVAAIVLVVPVLAAGVEIGQVFQQSHIPDITDVVLFTAGGVLGTLASLRFVRAADDLSQAPAAPATTVIHLPTSSRADVQALSPRAIAGPAATPPWGRALRNAAGGAAIAIVLAGLFARLGSEQLAVSRTDESQTSNAVEVAAGDVGTVAIGTGVKLSPAPAAHRKPTLTVMPLPSFPGAHAVWGASGRDSRGHIWFGVSAHGGPGASARVFELDPASGRLQCRGDVLSQLERAGRLRTGETQMKIHTKLFQAADGWLYFASMDEQGEKTDGSRLPTWGGHLWRLHPLRNPERWEHLAATRHALIALAVAGKRIYALGYFPHIVYQYDLQTQQIRSVALGAIGGHVSRNLFVDNRGHVYVPSVDFGRQPAAPLAATLVELDEDLQAVGRTPLEHYLAESAEDSHGIVGFHYLADASIVFVTHVGYLYRVIPSGTAPANVEPLGWFHPQGPAYIPSMFTFDGQSRLFGLSHGGLGQPPYYEWVTFDLESRLAAAEPIEIGPTGNNDQGELLLYGSITCDDAGRFYLGGAAKNGPVIVRIGSGATSGISN